jgi:hypothetical protein
MERDEFIKRAVEALKEVVESWDDTGRGTKSLVNDGDDIRHADIYQKLMYDYPDVNEAELKALVVYVSRYSTGSGPQDHRQGSAYLIEEMFGSHVAHDEDPMLRRKALTVVENLQRGAMSCSGVWQELYGLHAFSLLSRDCGGESRRIVSYEDLFGKEGCHVRDIALDEEGAWTSGRLVTALQGCISHMSLSTCEADIECRMDILFELLKHTMVQSIDRGHMIVVHAIYEGLLGCVEGLQGYLQSMIRCRISCMTAALIMECGMDVELKHGHVQSILMDVLAPERDSRRGKEDEGVLVVAGAVCIEYLVRYGIRHGGMKSWKSRFENGMIRSGMYNACIQEFIRLTKQEEPSLGELSTMSRALVLTASYSEDLRSWGVRVPGYSDAWHRYTHASPVVGVAWKVVSSTPGSDRHMLVLEQFFIESSEYSQFLPSREDCKDSLEEEEKWAHLLNEHLSTLVLITTALRSAIDSSDSTRRNEIISRIDKERDAVHGRIARLSHADDPLRLIEQADTKEHEQPRQPSLLLIRSYRECDGLLKSLSFSLKDSTVYTSTKHD